MFTASGNRFAFVAVATGLAAVAWACAGPTAPQEDNPPLASATTATSVDETRAHPPVSDTAPAPARAPGPAGEPAEPDAEPDAEPAGREFAGRESAGREFAGREFISEVQLLYRVVACAGDLPIPEHLDAAVVGKHCQRLNRRKARYRKRYLERARAFLTGLHPEGLPDTLVYPFAGGDLISALVAFPGAREITTISLEMAGDPRRIQTADRTTLRQSLSVMSREIGGLLSSGSNTSKNLSSAHKNYLPALLSSFLMGLAVHDLEPVSARFFQLREDGSIHYMDDTDIEALVEKTAERLKYDWQDANFSVAFANVELHFRRRGASPDEPVRVHRHIAANLDDRHLQAGGAVLRHLQAKGKVALLTKGASYLLWRKSFSRVREYMLGHLYWMLSDSTGIPPRYARQAGMKQTTFGRFHGSLLNADDGHNEDFRALWRAQPRRRLGFRFGYVDNKSNAHIVLTEPQ